MVSIYSVDPNSLIEKVAQELKKSDLVQPTDWAKFVKTGVAKERPPVDEDWWYIRAASILRSVFKLGPVGVSKLRTKYGSKKNRGVKPEKFKIASGNIIRTILQQLEKEGLVMQNKDDKRKGRVISPKGQSLLEKAAASLSEKRSSKSAVKKKPSVEKKSDKKADVAAAAIAEAEDSSKETSSESADTETENTVDAVEDSEKDSKKVEE